MARGDSVAHYGHAVPEGMFAQARPVQGNFNEALRPNFVAHEALRPASDGFRATPGRAASGHLASAV